MVLCISVYCPAGQIKKRTWGALTGGWVPRDIRDAIVDFTRSWSNKTDIPHNRFIGWLAISKSKFYTWIDRYGKINEHNATLPRDFWLAEWEREAIIRFCLENPLEGYRRLTFMMLDRNIVAVSPASTWRILSNAGLLDRWNRKPSKKGTGFVQPLAPHEHWHIDISYINICGTFYYLCNLLDGCSRPKTPLSLDDARRIVADYIAYYNNLRLHSSIGYIAPADKLNGREKAIFKERDQKLDAAREQRRIKRQQICSQPEGPGETYFPLTQTA